MKKIALLIMTIGLVSAGASSLIAAGSSVDISSTPIELSSIAPKYGGATDAGIELKIKPIQCYSAKCDSYRINGTICYPQWHNYDIWLLNKSGLTFYIDRVEYSAFCDGQPVPQFCIAYQEGVPADNYLNAKTFFVVSCDNITDSIPSQNILYFNCLPVYKVDNIYWERDHALPNNTILSFLYPFEQCSENVLVPNKIIVTVSGTKQNGTRLTLTTEFFPSAYTDLNQYTLPVGLPSDLPPTVNWKVLEGSILNATHRRAGVWAAKDGVFYMSNLTRFALDFGIVDAVGSQFRTGFSGDYKEDYYCWDQPVYAVEGGTVLWVANDQPDCDPINPPSPSPSGPPAANGLTIDHGNGVTSYYYHMKQGSISLLPGDKVTKGQEIGRVGCSGTQIPHLHYHLMYDPSRYVSGNTEWTVLPEGIPSVFNNFYVLNNSSKSYIKKGSINSGIIVEQNLPPQFDEISDQVIQEGCLFTLAVSASDPNNDAVVLQAFDLPRGAEFNDHGDGTATFNWMPDYDQGRNEPYSIKIIAQDNQGCAHQEMLNIIVHDREASLVSISLEGPEWAINDILLGGDRYSTVDGTRYGVPMHAIVNEGNVDVKAVMSYASWDGVDPSYSDLVDHFQTSAALESGHLITIQPPDSPYPQAVIRSLLKAGSRSPLSLHYTAPSSLTKPTTQMRAYYEIRAYPIEETQVK